MKYFKPYMAAECGSSSGAGQEAAPIQEGVVEGDGAAGEQEAAGQEGEKEEEKAYSAEDLAAKLEEAKASWKEETEKAIAEEQRKAKMSAEELEAEKTAEALKELEALRGEKAANALKEEAAKLLEEAKLPSTFASLVMGKSTEEAKKNVEAVSSAFSAAVQEAVEKRLAGKTPVVGGNAAPSASIAEAFKKALQ